MTKEKIAVAYIARGVDENISCSFDRFIESYHRYDSGLDHELYIIFKGFSSKEKQDAAEELFSSVKHVPFYLTDDHWDIGAYIDWSNNIEEDVICCLNTTSELISSYWLHKLYFNLKRKNIGLVGATGSFETLSELSCKFPIFPNPHIRSTSFMVGRELFQELTKNVRIDSKMDAYRFESGYDSLTRKVQARGLQALLVGANGCGYRQAEWAQSGTFRQALQENLLVADKQTRNYMAGSYHKKKIFYITTWMGNPLAKRDAI